jgi:hypothetical protein
MTGENAFIMNTLQMSLQGKGRMKIKLNRIQDILITKNEIRRKMLL